MSLNVAMNNTCDEELAQFFIDYSIKGFLHHDEGIALLHAAISANGPCLEIGSYCGKSTVYIGKGCQQNQTTLYAVDHHCGSEEHQLGESYHDPDLFDQHQQRINTLPQLQRTLVLADLTEHVVPIVASSAVVVRDWSLPLGLVFIDGGHSHESAYHDCKKWAEKIAPGGTLAIHDIYEKPEHGGQGPYLAMLVVLARGDFVIEKQVRSLVLLRKQ